MNERMKEDRKGRLTMVQQSNKKKKGRRSRSRSRKEKVKVKVKVKVWKGRTEGRKEGQSGERKGGK